MKPFAVSVMLALALSAAPKAKLPALTVYKTATCGCCAKWVEHMKANGFTVNVEVVPNTAVYRQKFGMPDRFASCHTTVAGKYTFEGHIPAADVKRFLAEKPAARGLAVPGMPLGSPGMEGVRSDPYQTLLVTEDGGSKVFEKH